MAKYYSVENKEEIETLLKAIETKECIIKELDAKILDVISENLIEEDIYVATQFETKFKKDLREITNYFLKINILTVNRYFRPVPAGVLNPESNFRK